MIEDGLKAKVLEIMKWHCTAPPYRVVSLGGDLFYISGQACNALGKVFVESPDDVCRHMNDIALDAKLELA